MNHASGIVVLLSLLCLLSAPARSSDLLTSVESEVTAPPGLQEFLNSSQVIRHRFVTVDIEYLWTLFESAQDLDSPDAVGPIHLKLFDDYSVEMKLVKVSHFDQLSIATLVTVLIPTLPGYDTPSELNIFADMTLKRDKSASARIWAAGDIYYIQPVENGPIHVITQLDPEKMPDFD